MEGLEERDIEAGVKLVAQDLNIPVDLDASNWKTIQHDLILISQSLGLKSVYPPYVQMLIEHIWSSSDKGKAPYTASLYQKARGIDGIVGDYLSRQLGYANDQEGHVRLVLVSLVRSYGIKAQKTLEDLCSDTGLNEKQIDAALEKLIDLRLVRHIERYYEISHDFIAKQVVSELVDSEEREVKRFQELLYSKAAAFSSTRSLLTNQELLMLYKHRERLVPGEAELRLIFRSWLDGEGPALYWLLNPAWKPQILTWMTSEVTEDNTDDDEKASAILLRRRLEGGPMTEQDFAGLRRYQHALELASLVQADASGLSDQVMLKGLRHKREEVRRACRGIIANRFREGKWSLLANLRQSSSKRVSAAYDDLVTNADVPMPPNNGSRLLRELRYLKSISNGTSTAEMEKAYIELKKMKPGNRALLLAAGLLAMRRGEFAKLLSSLKSRSIATASVLLSSISGRLSAEEFGILLTTYEEWNKLESSRKNSPAIYHKTRALADAVARTMRPKFSSLLNATVARIELTESSRTIILALLRFGQIEDVELILARVAGATSRVPFWTHTELGQAVARRMAAGRPHIPDFLLRTIKKQEFWGYKLAADLEPVERLPLTVPENRSLYIRVAAYALIGSADITHIDYLMQLTMHSYTLIARAAAIRLVSLLGVDAFKKLSSAIQSDMSQQQGKSLAAAIRLAEIEYYGVANVW